MNRTDRQEQERLKAEYLRLLAAEMWKNDPKMLDYHRKTIARIIELENGDLVEIEKPRIETRFHFGYGYGAGRDYDDAARLADAAGASADYFKERNLNGFNPWAKWLQRGDVYTRARYYGTDKESRIRALEAISDWDFDGMSAEKKAEYKKVGAEDAARINAAYEAERKAFEKRLDAYLKRYGTSKIETGVYWADE